MTIKIEKSRIMKMLTLFRATAVLSVILPALTTHLFSVVAFIVLIITSLKHRSLVRERAILSCNRNFYIIFCVFIVSYLFNYTFEAVGFSPAVIGNIEGLKLTILGLSTIVLLGCTFIIVSSLKISEKQKAIFFTYTVCAGGISALVTNIYWLIQTGGVFERYNFIPPITESQGLHLYYMAITVLLSISLLGNIKIIPQISRLFILTSCVLACFSILTVMVREGWAIFITSLLIYWFNTSSRSGFINRSILLLFLAGLIFIAVITLGAIVSFDDLSLLGNDGQGESVAIRLAMIEKGINLFFNSPTFGVGYGNFTLFVFHEVELESGTNVAVASPHNAIVLLTSETGIVGFFALVLLNFSMITAVKTRLRITDFEVTRAVASSLFPFLLLLSLDQIISNSLFMPPPTERQAVQFAYLLWILIAVLLAKSNYQDSKFIEHLKTI
jgi:O-antigen ligase